MKKFLIVLLLVIVPFQFSWAAAGAYCAHEVGKASRHFGHHSHTHHATDDGASKDGQNPSSKKSHKDCDYCQHSSQAPLPLQLPNVASMTGTTFSPSLTLSFDSHIPERPTKPDRAAVA